MCFFNEMKWRATRVRDFGRDKRFVSSFFIHNGQEILQSHIFDLRCLLILQLANCNIFSFQFFNRVLTFWVNNLPCFSVWYLNLEVFWVWMISHNKDQLIINNYRFDRWIISLLRPKFAITKIKKIWEKIEWSGWNSATNIIRNWDSTYTGDSRVSIGVPRTKWGCYNHFHVWPWQ